MSERTTWRKLTPEEVLLSDVEELLADCAEWMEGAAAGSYDRDVRRWSLIAQAQRWRWRAAVRSADSEGDA